MGSMITKDIGSMIAKLIMTLLCGVKFTLLNAQNKIKYDIIKANFNIPGQ